MNKLVNRNVFKFLLTNIFIYISLMLIGDYHDSFTCRRNGKRI